MTAISPPQVGVRPDPRRWWGLIVLSLSLLVVTVSNASVNIALPVLARELDADTESLQWVAAAYGLALASLLFTGGALADRYGRKGTWLCGLILSLCASLWAVWGRSIEVLIASRAVMGVAAAMLLPASLAILVDAFPVAERSRAISIWSGSLGIGGAFAPVATGLVLELFPYRVAFLLNVPLILIALAGSVLLRNSSDPLRAPIDKFGGVLSTVGIVLLVFGVVRAPRVGWTSAETFAVMVGAVLFLLAFVRWELRSSHPMIDVRVFRAPALVVSVAGVVFIFAAMQGVMFLTTQQLQLVSGHSPLVAGAVNVPWGLTILVGSIASALVVRSRGAGGCVVLAAALITISLALLAVLLLTNALPLWAYVLVMSGFQFGFGLAMAPLTVAVVAAVPARRAGGGGALNSFAREIGGALGVAIAGSLAVSIYAGRMAADVVGVPAGIRPDLTSSLGQTVNALDGLPNAALREIVLNASRSAFEHGFAAVLAVFAVGALALAAASARRLPQGRN